MSGRGRFLTLEGGEGVGKSTQLRALQAELQGRGIDCLATREPGGSPGAEAIRELLLRGEDDRWSVRAEALLFAAARADHVDKTILPALERGQWVLSDRFLDSSIAYQGVASGLGAEAVRQLHRIGSEDFLPDRTLVLVASEGAERARARDGLASDRFGGRAESFHAQVASAFRDLAAEDPQRIRLVDASGSERQVTARLLDELRDLLP